MGKCVFVEYLVEFYVAGLVGWTRGDFVVSLSGLPFTIFAGGGSLL